MTEKMATFAPHLSEYAEKLDNSSRARYVEKIELIGGFCDPYIIPLDKMTSLISAQQIPDVQSPDIFAYLIHTPSHYSGSELKCYKSLDAYKYFTAGLVRNLLIASVESSNGRHYALTAFVGHSQKQNEAALKVWVAAKDNGDILTAHCTCMAGMGETCSHITAVLFAVEATVRSRVRTSCTDLQCSWLDPGSSKTKVRCAPATDIGFSRPDSKWKKPCTDSVPKSSAKPSNKLPPPSSQARDEFYEALYKSGAKSTVLSTLPQYSINFIPKLHSLPSSVMTCYKPQNLSLDYKELGDKADEVLSTLSITDEQAVILEQATKMQSKSPIWFQQRAGRITASNIKAAAHTTINKPSVSLIKRICYPDAYKFATSATRWGCDHEYTAREGYFKVTTSKHSSLTIRDAGLFINPATPFIGATPDGLVHCDCCGDGVLEVKCPYCKKDVLMETACADPSFCLSMSDKGIQLKENHQYYYQVQTQLYVTKRKYCDFVVWTPSQIHIQRIAFNDSFFKGVLEKVCSFYRVCILREVVGKWFTRINKPLAVQNSLTSATCTSATFGNEGQPTVWCYCRRADLKAQLVSCCSDKCQIKKFHMSCVKLKVLPKRKWFCTDCRIKEE